MSHGPWVDVPDLALQSEPDRGILSRRPRVVITRLYGDAYPPLYTVTPPSGWSTVLIRILPGHDWQYAWLWCQLWLDPADTIMVERDVYPTSEQVAELAGCEYGWCTMAYSGRLSGLASHVGFVSISGDLMRRHRDLGAKALWRGHGHNQVVRYQGVAERIHGALDRAGHPVHVHKGEVSHRP